MEQRVGWGSEINHRVTQKAENSMTSLPREIFNDSFEVGRIPNTIIGKDSSRFYHNFTALNLRERSLSTSVFSTIFYERGHGLYFAPHYQRIYISKNPLLPSPLLLFAPIYIHAKTRDLFDSIYSSNSPVKSR